MDPSKLSSFEQETLLRWFFHHLRMEDRRILGQEYPGIYNRACGREIVQTRWPTPEESQAYVASVHSVKA